MFWIKILKSVHDWDKLNQVHHSEFLTCPGFYCIFLYQNYFGCSCCFLTIAILGGWTSTFRNILPKGYLKGMYTHQDPLGWMSASLDRPNLGLHIYIAINKKKIILDLLSRIQHFEMWWIQRDTKLPTELASSQLSAQRPSHNPFQPSLAAVGFLSHHEVHSTTQCKLRSNNNCWRAVTPSTLRKHICAWYTVEIFTNSSATRMILWEDERAAPQKYSAPVKAAEWLIL